MFNSNFPDRIPPTGREQNLAGDRYGRLVLLEEVAGQACCPSARKWAVHCDCGEVLKVTLNDMRRGKSRSCGCCWPTKHGRTKHGLSNHKLYRTHVGMMHRCYNPERKQFANYGARGVKVCERWHSVENFIEDMYPTYSPGLSLEREDNSLGYSKENCVWATLSEQGRNKRNNRLVSYLGKNICLAEACEITGLPYQRVLRRLNKYGWSTSRALESPDFCNPNSENLC